MRHFNVFSASPTMVQFLDLLVYVKLRDSLPKVADAHHHPLLDILQDSTITEANLAARIADLLIVKSEAVGSLCTEKS